MPGDARECRQRAARCLELAASAANDGIKQMFLNLSRHWEALAMELERAKTILDDEKGAMRLTGKRKRRKKSARPKHAGKRKKAGGRVRAKRANGDIFSALW